ncbi:MAG: putative sulfate exporter family transporter [Deltaproteobacteria bacterium]|nr:putative sulfate exporter family transporter [Deltaproteobacteria bacterium]
MPVGALVCVHPAVGSAAALGLGAVIALGGLAGDEARIQNAAKGLLALSVVGLGASLDLRDVLDVGALGASLAVASILGCLALGLLLAKVFRVDPITGLLVSAGTAICGGSAIAAVAPTVRARGHQITAALGTVFVLNAVALLVFPAVGAALRMDAEQFGLWSAIAIHDTSSVVGAAMTHGERALEIATTVKLSRALWIVPLTVILAWRARRAQPANEDAPRAARPWFIAGFVGLAVLVTLVPALQPAGEAVGQVARRLMVVSLFLVGASLSRPALRAVGVRPFLQGVLLWVVVAATSLGAVLLVV